MIKKEKFGQLNNKIAILIYAKLKKKSMKESVRLRKRISMSKINELILKKHIHKFKYEDYI